MSEQFSFDSRWFKDVPAEEVENLKAQLIGDKKTLDKLKEIVYNMVRSEEDVRFSDYDSPNWSHKQAHRFGKMETLRTIARLIDLDGQK
jgi:hypothetical protein